MEELDLDEEEIECLINIGNFIKTCTYFLIAFIISNHYSHNVVLACIIYVILISIIETIRSVFIKETTCEKEK